jgi:hypothetical protein
MVEWSIQYVDSLRDSLTKKAEDTYSHQLNFRERLVVFNSGISEGLQLHSQF